jgi:hypothetical protein
LNVHAPTEDKVGDIKERFYEGLEQVLDKFPRYHMNMLSGDFNANVGREDIFKPTITTAGAILNTNLVLKATYAQLCFTGHGQEPAQPSSHPHHVSGVPWLIMTDCGLDD